jgi:predicted ribosomally synthesized peptide with nif11-like leader
MSVEAVWEFRERLNSDQALQADLMAERRKGEVDLVALAQRHGIDMSKRDWQQAAREKPDIELTEFELALVSGGSGTPNPIGSPCIPGTKGCT